MSRFRETVITLFFRRLKMNALIISSLVIFQMAGLVASLPGETTTIWLKHMMMTTTAYTGNMIVMLTLLWAFIVPLYATKRKTFAGKTSKYIECFSADVLFMLFVSLLGSLTAVLLSLAGRLLILFYRGFDGIHLFQAVSLRELFITLLALCLNHLLVFSFGYLIGEAVQVRRAFQWFIPLMLFFVLFLSLLLFGKNNLLAFYFAETNLLSFTAKCVVSAVLFMGIAFVFQKRSEVGR